jgi:hypothetical protein
MKRRRFDVRVRLIAFGLLGLLFLMCGVAAGQSGAPGLSSSNSGPNAFSGVDIAALLGADRFYAAGYPGTRAVVATIEGTVQITTHQTMTNVTERVFGTGVPNSNFGTNHNHPTAVSHAMSGSLGANPTSSTYYGYGIAYGAETWGGAIATGFNSNGSYQTTWASRASPYSTMLVGGINGRTADVINSSWWFAETTGTQRDTMGVDALAFQSGKVLVHIAGNAGPGPNSVSGYGAGYNGITVGSLGADMDSPPYQTVSNFSSRGPSDFAFATSRNRWNIVPANTARRASVDLVAPGQNLTLAGPSGGNNWYNFNLAGTSFAAPIVAGGAGLLVDAGRDLYGSSAAVDGRLIKAILMNSATKIPGWDNGQRQIGALVSTDQALDFSSGAGRLNLDRAFDQYVHTSFGGAAVTTDVAGTLRGDLGNIGAVGWDFGIVDASSPNYYYIDSLLSAESVFTATLTWFAARDPGSLSDFFGSGEISLANLDLRIFSFDNLVDRNLVSYVAESVSLYNVAEHLHFEIDSDGYYGIEVSLTDFHWNFLGSTEVAYGLAWSGTVAIPEPSSILLVAVTLGCLGWYRKRSAMTSFLSAGKPT